MRDVVRILVLLGSLASLGAQHVTKNFIVQARTAELAQEVAEVAEQQRDQLAIAWFGHSLEPWYQRCKVTVQDGPKLGAGGKTKFRFEKGEVSGWDMFVQGSVERILDSVIPHEVNHTILACYFRRPVPRWADEGAASLFEHQSEIKKQQDLVNQLMQNGRRIPLRILLDMKEYPTDMSQTLALYAQGYSLTHFLVQSQGRTQFLKFLVDAEKRGWDAALQSFYARKNIETLEREWCSWVMAGSPRLNLPSDQMLVQQRATDSSSKQVRAQSPDAATALKQLRQQIRNEASTVSESPAMASKLEAPNPRQQSPRVMAENSSTKSQSLPMTSALSGDLGRTSSPAMNSNGSVSRTASGTATRQPLELTQRAEDKRLQPLELIRIDEPSEAEQFGMPTRFQREAAATQRQLRETRLRTEAPTTSKSDRLAPYEQFPARR